MKNLISNLEMLGANAELQTMSAEQLVLFCAEQKISPSVLDAALSGDREFLEELLDARSNVMSILFPAEDEESESDEAPADDDTEEKEALSSFAVNS